MPKIAKLTWLHNGNYGTVFQAYALQKFLQDHSYDVVDIDYQPSLKTQILRVLKSGNAFEMLSMKAKSILNKRSGGNDAEQRAREQECERFVRTFIRRTPVCRSPQDVTKTVQGFDAVVCGSDQIWSPALYNPVFYLATVPDDIPKISYAPSFGRVGFTERKQLQIGRFLKRFNAISVREAQGAALVKLSAGIDAEVVVDPVMLLTDDDWKELALAAGLPAALTTNSYIFMYMLTPNPVYCRAVAQFAQEQKLQVVYIGTPIPGVTDNFILCLDASPEQWLSYLCYAELVCTDSFHGAVFSEIFAKEFVLFKRFKDTSKASENSRVYNLTEMSGTTARLLGENNTQRLWTLQPIDYQLVHSRLNVEIEKSKQWLLSSLEGAVHHG